ncbi:TPA: type I toxin-antitoxin system Ibs family toxin, partial [Escherichia coli]|nr:type I toxin-antitoxin system Ibs family toxin [Escherichia coli]MBS9239887.1 type I toxin-antitoxin system Ibs family toxin [Escherichia coli]HCD8748229.1 type I toxin-antitoxin system Ibs family toxin [Escherichia coli]HDV6954236.1 type I toxin-antitoxin system Ibs family toxin [Escherichia coli]
MMKWIIIVVLLVISF